MPAHIKPENINGLNVGHTYNSYVRQFFEFGQLDKELVNDVSLTIDSAPVVDDADVGIARTFTDASSVAELAEISGENTVVVVCRPYGTRANGSLSQASFISLDTAYQAIVRYNGSGYFEYKYRGGSLGYKDVNGNTFSGDVEFFTGHAIAVNLSGPNEMKGARNGTLDTNTDAAIGASDPSPPMMTPLLVSFGSEAIWVVSAIAIIDNLIPEAGLISISNDPWDLVSVAPEPNIDPELDTPQSDITIQTGQSGTIDCAANFSDANAGDTLTYSISPAMSSGFSFNTATGVITYNGTQAIAAAKSYTVICDDGQGGSPATDTFTITVLTATFIIDSVSTATPDAGSTISVTYSNADSTLTASVAAGALNKVSDNGNIAVFDVPVPPLFGDKSINYETAITITFSDGTDTDTESISIQVPSDELFAQIDTIDADGIYDNDVGVAIGDYAHAKDIVGDVYIDLTDGLTSANPTINSSFNYAIYDVTDGVWEDYAPVSYGAETEKPVITLNGSANLVWVQGVSWVDPGATVTDNVDATRQITSSSAPNVNTTGVYVLPYNTADVSGNVANTVNRTVTVSSADSTPDPINFTDVANAELSTVHESIGQITGVDAGQTLTATGNLTVSNDGGATWSSSVQMVTGQTYVKATVTSSAANETTVNSTGAVNGITDTFSVTTKALVTLSYTTPDADAIISQSTGTVLSTTVPIVEAWTAAPENGGSIVDSWANVTILNGIATFSGSAVSASTDYLLIFRSAGNVPTGYYRTMGQFA